MAGGAGEGEEASPHEEGQGGAGGGGVRPRGRLPSSNPWTKAGLRIRIHLIRIRIQHFRLNTDPDL